MADFEAENIEHNAKIFEAAGMSHDDHMWRDDVTSASKQMSMRIISMLT